MTKARCFNCGVGLPIGKPLEELVKIKLPIFCCTECSIQFPDAGTPEFDIKFNEVIEKYLHNPVKEKATKRKEEK